jgi:hypothetical protein
MGTVVHRMLSDFAALHGFNRRFNSYIRFEGTRLVSRLGLVLVGPAVGLALWWFWWGR